MLSYEIKDYVVHLKYNNEDLRCRWSAEAAANIEVRQGIDIIEDITNLVNYEVLCCIKKKVIDPYHTYNVLTKEDKEKLKEIFKVSEELSKKRREARRKKFVEEEMTL